MIKAMIVGFAVISQVPLTNANEYQFDGGLGYGDTRFDLVTLSGSGLRAESYSISGNAYLSKVTSSVGPHLVAAFLNKASSVGVSYSKFRFKFNSDFLGESVFSAMNSRFVLADKIIVEAGIEDEDENGKDDFTTIAFGAGLYLTDSSDIKVTHRTRDLHKDDDGLDRKSTTIRYHGFNQFRRAAIEYDIAYAGFDTSNLGNGNSMAAALRYFPNRKLSIGGRFGKSTNMVRDTTTAGMEVSYFFNDKIYGVLNYSRTIRDGNFDSKSRHRSILSSIGARI